MSGLRIHHPTVRDAVLVVTHPGDPSIDMKPKDLYVHLDSEGNSIVSAGVWERLQEATRMAAVPIMILNEVPDPPTLRIGEVPAPERRTVRQYHDGQVADANLAAVAQQFAPHGIHPRIA